MGTAERIRERLASLAPEQVEITDDSAAHAGHAGAASGGGHFHLTIVSNRFAGQTAVGRHRLIYQALGDLMGSHIHALSITALAPDEL
jgi:BolA protein